ncbi:hypothetical protein [Nocardia sp. CY41]|uniref:hypothetical protein n=1 Tax=Nocardia sp. CY41 TaxID=2608686 RepID=UPI001F2DC959|nr:hypothetical protein [Nocardia sp. CY41]
MPREVGGGIVRRWYCDNYRCPYSWHETQWCPNQMSSEVAEVPLPPDQQQAVWEWRAERARRAAADAARARRVQPAAPPDPGYGWLLVVGLLFVVVALGVLLVG